jgi:acyl carrier protein
MGRGEPSAAATAIIDRLRRLGGARVEVMRGDVSQREDVARVLASIDTAMPPLAGLIHAAGVLEDSTILQLDRQSLRRTMAPKVDGARHLHELTQAGKLDFFVLYSSGSGLLGTPGQANYAAANAYLDALAHHRAQRGLPAMSVNWGPFSEVGMVAGQVARLAKGGMGSLTPAQGTEALELLLPRGITQVAVLPFQWEAWRQQTPLLSQLLSAKEKTASRADETLLRALAAADEKQRKALLEQHLRQQLATVLRLPLHRIAPGTPFNTLGLDSLMALELRNRLEGNLGLRLPATLVWKHPTAEALAAYLTEALQLPSAHEQQEPPAEPAPEPPAAALDRISELSDEEVERLFAEKLMKGAG